MQVSLFVGQLCTSDLFTFIKSNEITANTNSIAYVMTMIYLHIYPSIYEPIFNKTGAVLKWRKI